MTRNFLLLIFLAKKILDPFSSLDYPVTLKISSMCYLRHLSRFHKVSTEARHEISRNVKILLRCITNE